MAKRSYPTPSSRFSKRGRTMSSIFPKSVGTQTSRRRKFKAGGRKKTSMKGWKKVKKSKLEKNGVCTVWQTSTGLTTSATTNPWLAVGTCTFPASTILDTVCQAIVKNIFTQQGINIETMRQDVEGGTIGDRIAVRWYVEQGETPTSSNAWTATVANYSYATIANDLSQWMRANLTPGSQVLEIRFLPQAANIITDYASIDISTSKLKVSVSTALTLHNVSTPSVAADEDETDDVDAVALIGTSYMGKGSGSNLLRNVGVYNAAADIGFWPRTAGTIERAANDNQQNLGIPLPEQVESASRSIKAYLAPGSSAVSKLRDYYVMNTQMMISKLLVILKGSVSPLYLNSMKSGKFVFHCFRREVEPNPAAPAAVKLNYNHTNIIKAELVSWKRRVTAATTYINGVA